MDRIYILPSLYINHNDCRILPTSCRLVWFYTLLHHKSACNFTVKLHGLSCLPAVWWDVSWKWNLITVLISRKKTSFTVWQKCITLKTQVEVRIKACLNDSLLILLGNLPLLKFAKHGYCSSPNFFEKLLHIKSCLHVKRELPICVWTSHQTASFSDTNREKAPRTSSVNLASRELRKYI